MTTDQQVGEAVHLMQWRQGLTTTQLAEAMGLSKATMSRKLHGTVRWSVEELMVVAAVLDVPSAHQLRHTFATRAYQSTRDIMAVSRLLGHASVSTTQGYVGVPDESLAAAVAAATLPRQSDSGLAA